MLQTLLVQLLVVQCSRSEVSEEDAALAQVALQGASEELPDVVAAYLGATLLVGNEARAVVRRRAAEQLLRQPRVLGLAVDGLLDVVEGEQQVAATRAAEALVSLDVQACTLAVKKLRAQAHPEPRRAGVRR